LSDTPGSELKIILVTPDVLGKSFFEESSFRVLELWGKGSFQLAVNRWLLVRYLRVLNRVGVSAQCARWWSWWLTSSLKTRVIEVPPASQRPVEICAGLAREAGAEAIVCGVTSVAGHPIPWITPSDFLSRMKSST